VGFVRFVTRLFGFFLLRCLCKVNGHQVGAKHCAKQQRGFQRDPHTKNLLQCSVVGVIAQRSHHHIDMILLYFRSQHI
jgi:hypothetical protein